jgi:hypothetical protein
VEGGGGEGGERRRRAWRVGGEVSEVKCEWAAGWQQLLMEGRRFRSKSEGMHYYRCVLTTPSEVTTTLDTPLLRVSVG